MTMSVAMVGLGEIAQKLFTSALCVERNRAALMQPQPSQRSRYPDPIPHPGGTTSLDALTIGALRLPLF